MSGPNEYRYEYLRLLRRQHPVRFEALAQDANVPAWLREYASRPDTFIKIGATNS